MPIILGHVVLYVTSLERSARFYEGVLGCRNIASAPGMVAFSSGRTHHELLLIEIGGKPKARKEVEPGLYHIGFKIGNKPEELKAMYQKLLDNKVPIVGGSDHGVTHSLYLLDPDGNEIEVYVDVSDEWKKNPEVLLRAPKGLGWL